MLGALAAPLAQALLVVLFARPPGLRDITNIGLAVVGATFGVALLGAVPSGEGARLVLARPLPNVDVAFMLDPLGALAAALVLGLSAPQAMHAVGMMRARQSKAPSQLMALCALSTAAAVAVALSANLFSFFVCYQALIMTAFALVGHDGDERARRSAGIVLATLLVSSIVFFLPAMVWTYALTGTLDFRAGGVLVGRVGVLEANLLLVLFVLGLAVAGAPPLHRWLTVSSSAPHPALVSILAVAVLPAGGVGLLKVIAFVFGPALHDALIAARGFIAIAGVGMGVAALIALSKQDIRERLAYSCLAQALSVMVGALLALPAGLFASTLQIVALSSAAATLLMAAGTVWAVTGRETATQFAGLGRVMPWTFAAFAVAAASMIGMPPFAGAWAKLWLITAAAGSGLIWAAGLVSVAAVLTFTHLGPLAANALAARAPGDVYTRPDGASFLLVAPAVVCAAATLWLLVLADPLASFLSPVWTPQP